jgi:hypothetical protein
MGHVRKRLHEWIRKDDTENETRNEQAHIGWVMQVILGKKKKTRRIVQTVLAHEGVRNHPSLSR